MSQTDIIIIALLSLFCLIMLKVVLFLWWRQQARLKENQQRIKNLQVMLQEQYQHRVESIQIIVNAMDEGQCELTEGCIRLRMLISQIDAELLKQEKLAIIDFIYAQTEHMPIKEDWKKLDKKVKTKLTNERYALEGQHRFAIEKAVKVLKQHVFADFSTLH